MRTKFGPSGRRATTSARSTRARLPRLAVQLRAAVRRERVLGSSDSTYGLRFGRRRRSRSRRRRAARRAPPRAASRRRSPRRLPAGRPRRRRRRSTPPRAARGRGRRAQAEAVANVPVRMVERERLVRERSASAAPSWPPAPVIRTPRPRPAREDRRSRAPEVADARVVPRTARARPDRRVVLLGHVVAEELSVSAS